MEEKGHGGRRIKEAIQKNVDVELFKHFKNIWLAVIVILATVVTIVTPLVTGWFNVAWSIVYILIVLTLTVSAFTVALHNYSNQLKANIAELNEELDARDEYYDLIDDMYSSPVELVQKNTYLDININSQGDDLVRFKDVISASEGHVVDEYYGLIGITSEKDVTWDDLDIRVGSAEIGEYRRRDYENLTRFIIQFKLNNVITDNDSYELVYDFTHDVATVENDEVYTVIREPTECVNVQIRFPEGWVPQRCVPKGRGSLERELPKPVTEQDNEGRWWIKWSCSSCTVGESYVLDWTATTESVSIDEERGPFPV